MKKNIESYNNWLKGQSTKEEFHDLQKEGLDNPFIGDALEGVELHHKNERGQILSHLDQKLDSHKWQSESQSKVITLWPYAIAAGFALLFGSIFFLKNDNPLAESTDMATIDDPTQTEDQIVALQVESTPANKKDAEEIKNTTPPKIAVESSPKIIVTPKEPNKELATNRIEKAPKVAETVAAKPIEAIALNESAETMANESESIQLPEVATDQIVMSVKGTEQPKEEILKSKDQGLSQLAKRSQDGKAALMQKSTSLTRAQTPVVYPEIGQEAFNTILKNNRFPKDAMFMRGIREGDTITISFNLDKNGMPTNIESGGFEQNIIEKILKESGKWKAPENIGRIKYQLPVYSL